MKEKNIRDEFLDDVIQCVKFQWDRHKMREELADHIEDRRDYYVAKGMAEDEAELKAVSTMGDAKEIGEALNMVHKPWIGRLWIVSTVLLVLVLMLALVNMRSIVHNVIDIFASTDAVIEQSIEENTEAYTKINFEINRLRLNEEVEISNVKIYITDLLYLKPGGNPKNSMIMIYGYEDNGSSHNPPSGNSFAKDSVLEVSKDGKDICIRIPEEQIQQDYGKNNLGIFMNYKTLQGSRNDKPAFQIEVNVPEAAEHLSMIYDKYGEYAEINISLKGVKGGDDDA
ncbi:MAG TPA: permease prefix domain 1-containing protein [Anaerovoracaceae bacterium]|nr:permease prefix domain 1-containing protein [Anaerovoracaceae bacterium]